jgi:hypothetical protein
MQWNPKENRLDQIALEEAEILAERDRLITQIARNEKQYKALQAEKKELEQ